MGGTKLSVKGELTPAAADPRRWKALALLVVVNFMVILDSQIVILALPSIERALGFSAGGAQWVMSAYLLGFGGLLLFGGRLGDLLGRRRVFLFGTALFGLASLWCGLAWSPGVLIAARALHGVSAALMAPTALAILITTFAEGPERNRALAVWGGFGGLGATAALLIGGALTDVLGWEWIFFLNIPVAAALLLLAPTLLRESRRHEGRARGFDLTGAVALTGGLTLLCLAIVRAPEAGWASATTFGTLVAAVALVAAFVLVETRTAAPLIPLRIFRGRGLTGGNLVVLLAGMAAWGTGLAVSSYAQGVLGYSPLVYGVGTSVLTVMAIVGSFAAQALLPRSGPRLAAAGGALLLCAGDLVLTRMSPGGGYLADLFPGLFIFGAGLGASTVAGSVAALSGASAEDAGVASGTNTAVFQIGGALGAAIFTSVSVAHTAGATATTALTHGLSAGFVSAAVPAALAVLTALILLRGNASAGRIHR